MRGKMYRWLLILIILISSSGTAQTLTSDHVEAALVSEVNAIQSGQPFWVAVRLKIEPHWHIYWRNPGDTGYPTAIKWDLPQGFTAGEIQWPYPKSFEFGGLINLGYENETILLVEITPPSTLHQENVELKCEASWLVCHESCVPGSAELSLSFSVDNKAAAINPETAKMFAQARERLPIQTADWQIQSTVKDEQLQILAIKPSWFVDDISAVTFFPYETELIQYASQQKFEVIENGYLLTVQLSDKHSGELSQVSGVLVCDNGWRDTGSEKALTFQADILNEFSMSTAGQSGNGLSSILFALLFAFLGGMILNLMPCVLPVLSIKIMGLVQQAGEEQKKRVQHGLIFTLGVLLSFWILAGLLLLLRAGGEQLGWGFQLQSPEFVIVLAVLLFLFGISMFGVFEIGTSLTAVGASAASKSGLGGSFFSGVLATVVATPCTAPFMGSALGFALSQPALLSLLIFTFLGLGMAAPYMLLTSIPALLRFVPKPGPWMESLKQFMGFLLLATVLWLLWVLSLQAGSTGVLILLLALLVVSFGGWVFGRWGNITKTKRTRKIAQVVALLSVIISLYIAFDNIEAMAAGTEKSTTQQGKIEWQKFSPELVRQLRDEGKPIFLDFTAAWCLSCQVNEKVAFGSDEVQEAFIEKEIVAVKADWTNRDAAISKALSEFGRNSVPLYVLFSPDPNIEPLILPEVITPGIVLDAIGKLF